MVKVISIGVGVVIAAILIFAATRPNSFRVTRSLEISASADKIFAWIDNFHKWEAWSPWEKMDPQMKRSYSGKTEGTGAIYAWESEKTGYGRMEVLETAAPTRIVIQLDFLKPMQAHNKAEFVLEPKGKTTLVTWSMYGPNSYFDKLMGLCFNMDQMVGKDFATGLSNLQVVVTR